MKRTAMNHTKLKRLSRELKVPLYSAVGILESLWHLTAREAPAGNIGKLTDDDIAASIDWERPAEELTAALVASAWLDSHPEHRLIVHDWHEHCDDTVDNQLARSIQLFANGSMPRMTRLPASERARITAQYASKSADERARALDERSDAHEKPLPKPLPVPLPLPEPQPHEPTVEEIVCAHPLAVTRKLTELQVTPSMSSAVVDALASGETRAALLTKTQAIAQIVLAEWPPGELRFLKSIDRFFRECEFNKPLEEWRYGSSSDSRQTSRVSPSTDRGTNTRSRIGDAVARATGARPGPVDGRDAGELSQPGTARRDTGHVAGPVAGDGGSARPGCVSPRTLEGHS